MGSWGTHQCSQALWVPPGPDSSEEEEGLLSVLQSALPMNICCKVLISLCLKMLEVVRFSMTICCVIKRQKSCPEIPAALQRRALPMSQYWGLIVGLEAGSNEF